jgi:hypothetical protein
MATWEDFAALSDAMAAFRQAAVNLGAAVEAMRAAKADEIQAYGDYQAVCATAGVVPVDKPQVLIDHENAVI